METENNNLSTRWNVTEEKVTDTQIDKNNNPKPRTTYYWVLNPNIPDPPEIAGSDLRYYPLFCSPTRYPEGGVFYIPENHVINYDQGNPYHPFPDVPLNIYNARDLDGNIKSIMVANLADFRTMREKGKLKCNFAVLSHRLLNLETIYEYLGGLHGEHIIFRHVKLDARAQYVKLCDKDVALMCTGGGRNQPDEIFMTRKAVEWFASNDGGTRQWFRIRIGDGTEREFEMDSHVSVTREEWQKRLNRAINSIDGGWNRMINPVLKLYLVPLGDNLNELSVMAQAAQAATDGVQKCLQTFQVFASAALLANNLEV